MPIPDFIIIGAMKAGTTSLYHYLAAHDQIDMSSMKETNYFIAQKNYEKGHGWYRSLFREDGRLTGEASPNYTKRHIFGDVPRRIHECNSDVKLVYLVRDPIERILSHYVHNYAHGRESRSFEAALSSFENNNYLETSKYYFQIRAFLDYFDRDRILVLESRQLLTDGQNSVKRVLEFLGVEGAAEVPMSERRFHASSSKMRRSALERHVSFEPAVKLLKRVLPSSLTEPVDFARPVPSQSMMVRLKEALVADAEAFRSLIGDPLDSWQV
ncbi:MAG: sulfotransferase domain-containing protein [Rhodothermia bacterium]|nr:sulfotransferase domain-containing protein [Rhodothermia bacterium]